MSNFAKRQIPFATVGALNDTIADVRTQIVERTWPASVTIRNKRFAGVAFRRKFATKRKLIATLYATRGSDIFQRQALGETRQPRGRYLAVPSGNIKLTAKGVRSSQRPANLKRTFTLKTKSGTLGLFQRTSKTKIRLMYALPTSARVRKSFRFYEEAQRITTRNFGKHFVKRFNQGMRTAKL